MTFLTNRAVIEYARQVSGVLLFTVLWATFLGLNACAYAPQTEKLNAQPIQSIPSSVELTEVPFFAQEEYQCGPAALATVMNYRHQAVLPEQLVPWVYVPKRQGSFQVEMMAATRKFGLVPYRLAPSLPDLLKEVAAGNPVLVLQNLAFDHFPQWHFAVVVGYDLASSSIYLRSATTRRWQTSLSNFEQTWRKSNYWGVVIVPPNQIPITATPAAWLQAAYDLQSLGQLSAASSAYEVATQHWPNDPNVWVAYTNLLYQQQQYPQALSVFTSVLPKLQKIPLLWNNYAYVLQAAGCPKAAVSAAHCALSLSPNDANIQQTLSEMQSPRAVVQNQEEGLLREYCQLLVCPQGQ